MACLTHISIGVREDCIISVTTLRVEGSIAILLKVAQSFPSHFQQAFGLATLSLTLAWCTQPSRLLGWQDAPPLETCIT